MEVQFLYEGLVLEKENESSHRTQEDQTDSYPLHKYKHRLDDFVEDNDRDDHDDDG